MVMSRERQVEAFASTVDAALTEIDAGELLVTDLIAVCVELSRLGTDALKLVTEELDGPARKTLHHTGRFVRSLPALVAHTIG